MTPAEARILLSAALWVFVTVCLIRVMRGLRRRRGSTNTGGGVSISSTSSHKGYAKTTINGIGVSMSDGEVSLTGKIKQLRINGKKIKL